MHLFYIGQRKGLTMLICKKEKVLPCYYFTLKSFLLKVEWWWDVFLLISQLARCIFWWCSRKGGNKKKKSWQNSKVPFCFSSVTMQISKFKCETNWAELKLKSSILKKVFLVLSKSFIEIIRAELGDGLLWMFAEEIGWEGGFEGGVIGYQGGVSQDYNDFDKIFNSDSNYLFKWFSNNIWIQMIFK